MKTIRMRFSKTGRAIYISHLDLIRCIQRAVVRAGLPAAYSEGFHPHMQTSFGATLSLGYSSTGEILDLTLTEELAPETVMEQLNRALPAGIHIEEAGEPVSKYRELGFGVYRAELPCDQPEQLAEAFQEMMAQPELLVEKKTKRGKKETDILPLIAAQETEVLPGKLVLHLTLAAANTGALNPMLLIQTLLSRTENKVGSPSICRTALLTTEKSKFF